MLDEMAQKLGVDMTKIKADAALMLARNAPECHLVTVEELLKKVWHQYVRGQTEHDALNPIVQKYFPAEANLKQWKEHDQHREAWIVEGLGRLEDLLGQDETEVECKTQ